MSERTPSGDDHPMHPLVDADGRITEKGYDFIRRAGEVMDEAVARSVSGDDHGHTGEARCSCGVHATVMGTVPDPGCIMHGDRGMNAWATCEKCGRTWRHVVGHGCEVSS